MTYALYKEACFLLDRLNDFASGSLGEFNESTVIQAWQGHVAPSMARLRYICDRLSEGDNPAITIARAVEGAIIEQPTVYSVRLRYEPSGRGVKSATEMTKALMSLIGDEAPPMGFPLPVPPPGYCDEIDSHMKYEGWGNEPGDPTFPIRDKLRRAYDWDAWNAYDKGAATVENGMLARMETSNDWAHIACGDPYSMKRATATIIEQALRKVYPSSMTPSAITLYVANNNPSWISMVAALRQFHIRMASIHSSINAEALIGAALYARASTRNEDMDVAVDRMMNDKEFAIAYNEFVEPAAPQPRPATPDKTYTQLENWFFRELSDEQRLSLITIVMGNDCAKEATTRINQRRCFAHIIEKAAKHEKR